MNAKLLSPIVLFLAGCGSSGDLNQRKTCISSPDLNKADQIRGTPGWRKASALYAIRDLREVQELAQSTWFGTGVFSKHLGNIAGTDSYNLKLKVRSVEFQVAEIKAVEFSLETGGKSPLPSKAEWACRVLAISVGNLDIGQSDNQFLQMASSVEQYLIRTYQSNGGQDLRADLLVLDSSGGIR